MCQKTTQNMFEWKIFLRLKIIWIIYRVYFVFAWTRKTICFKFKDKFFETKSISPQFSIFTIFHLIFFEFSFVANFSGWFKCVQCLVMLENVRILDCQGVVVQVHDTVNRVIIVEPKSMRTIKILESLGLSMNDVKVFVIRFWQGLAVQNASTSVMHQLNYVLWWKSWISGECRKGKW